jgi:hypothetical protein
MKTLRTAAMAVACAAGAAQADEGGVSFWLPGQFGSFAAVPAVPGWSMAAVYYHASTDAGGEKQFARGGRINAGLDVTADMLFLAPSYAFAEPVLGGQLGLQVTGVYGRAKVDVNATLTGPGGAAVSGAQGDSNTGIGDLYPMASLKWNRGVHNWMAYGMAGVPVGEYDRNRLANLGTNHWSLDGGGGYTYLNDKTGREFSAVLGVTYNFENEDTNYRNGNSWHLDWAASQFLSEKFHLGLVGYFYGQLSGDSGSGATLGDFKSQVSAIGPQAGWFLANNWYLNLKGFYEFDAQNRPEGWNTWLTLSVPLGGKK